MYDLSMRVCYTLFVGETTESNNGTGVDASCSVGTEILRGRDGIPGRDGSPGRDGRDGRDGSKGEKGDPNGQKGEIGMHGAPGPYGERGSDGERGIPGERGFNGLPSLPGRTGKSGPPGERGERGSDGTPGEHGTDGLPGVRGILDERGAPGVPGERGAGLWGCTMLINHATIDCLWLKRNAILMIGVVLLISQTRNFPAECALVCTNYPAATHNYITKIYDLCKTTIIIISL